MVTATRRLGGGMRALTVATCNAFLDALTAGVSYAKAAERAGLDVAHISHWIERGQRELRWRERYYQTRGLGEQPGAVSERVRRGELRKYRPDRGEQAYVRLARKAALVYEAAARE